MLLNMGLHLLPKLLCSKGTCGKYFRLTTGTCDYTETVDALKISHRQIGLASPIQIAYGY